MNICFISQEFPPETGWGGIGTYVYNIARGLAEIGHHVDVITRAVHHAGSTEEIEGCLVVHRVWQKEFRLLKHFPFQYFHLYSRFYSTLDRPLGWGIGAYKQLQRICKEKHLDIVEIPEHNADGFVYAGAQWLKRHIIQRSSCPRTKFIVKLHMPSLYHYQLNNLLITPDIRLINHFERWTARQADHITSPSQELAQRVSNTWKIPKENIAILPYPIDDSLFIPMHREKQRENKILFVGRLELRKGVAVLIEAFHKVHKQFPDTKLLLIGADNVATIDGQTISVRVYLEQKLRDYQLASQVEFLGRIDRQKLPQYYQTSRFCVFPSNFDNFPNVCLEAMSCGKPVIASDSGGIPEMIKNGIHGLLVPPDDPKALSEAILRLLKDKPYAEKLGQNARRRVETMYAKSIIAKKTAEFYLSLLNQ